MQEICGKCDHIIRAIERPNCPHEAYENPTKTALEYDNLAIDEQYLRQHSYCATCDVIFGVGCSPFCRDRHGMVGRTHHEFEAYYDMGLDAQITTRDQRRQLLKEAKADAKDGMRKGDLSARLDRVKADRKSKGLDRRPTNPVYFY